LSGHFLQQNINVSTPLCRFRFPSNTIIRAGQTVTVCTFSTTNLFSGGEKKLSAAFHFYTIYYTVLKKQNIPEDAA